MKFSKSHTSQTHRRAGNSAVRFTTICLSNMPLNFLSSFDACLPYKITYFSNSQFELAPIRHACLPYKITYFSNYLASRRNLPTRLSAIKNYTLLKRYFYEKLPFRGLTTIKNYTPLKPVSQSDAQNIRLTTIKNYIPIKLLSSMTQS